MSLNDAQNWGGAYSAPPQTSEAPPSVAWHVETRAIVKRFGGAQALRGVDVRIRQATVHALVGENGAGKSTLGRVIAGAIMPDEGELLINGASVRFHSPRHALRSQITLIAQELALVPQLTTLENVFLGAEPSAGGFLKSAQLRKRFADLNARTQFDLDPDVRVDTLRIADQQKVEIMRALARDARLIIMDEPTAALPAADHDRLFNIIRQLRSDGVTIVYVSHFLEEVLALADDVTVLKDGAVVLASPAAQQTPATLVDAMIGRALAPVAAARGAVDTETPAVLSTRGLTRVGAFADISLDLHAREIVGLAGLVGAGRSEVARALFGADRFDAGTLLLDGRPLRVRHPADAIKAGIAMLPESRKDQGLLMRRPIRENVSLPHLRLVGRGPFVAQRRERHDVDLTAEKVDLRARNLAAPVHGLSGGNQQKALFAKWLLGRPKVLIADEPTRGVDVGAKAAIHELLLSLAAQGAAILLISSEFDEIVRLSHRVLVMRTGRIVGEFRGDEIEESALVRAAFGGVESSASAVSNEVSL